MVEGVNKQFHADQLPNPKFMSQRFHFEASRGTFEMKFDIKKTQQTQNSYSEKLPGPWRNSVQKLLSHGKEETEKDHCTQALKFLSARLVEDVICAKSWSHPAKDSTRNVVLVYDERSLELRQFSSRSPYVCCWCYLLKQLHNTYLIIQPGAVKLILRLASLDAPELHASSDVDRTSFTAPGCICSHHVWKSE